MNPLPPDPPVAGPFANNLPFLPLMDGVGAGYPLPAGWAAVATLPLLVLVGVTGVGKSTTLQALAAEAGVDFALLPDRRVLTDSLIIAAMRAADGLPPAPVSDRKQRFAYTRRFREQTPAGMAATLPLISVDSTLAMRLLVFDGLRGENEVAGACNLLPHARFVMLDAPDAVRVMRLLGRADPFDRITAPAQPLQEASALVAGGLAGAEAQAVFGPHEQRVLLDVVQSGAVTPADLRSKVEIVLEERRNYDPTATRMALVDHAGDRALIVDTTRVSASEAARQIATALSGWWPSRKQTTP